MITLPHDILFVLLFTFYFTVGLVALLVITAIIVWLFEDEITHLIRSAWRL